MTILTTSTMALITNIIVWVICGAVIVWIASSMRDSKK